MTVKNIIRTPFSHEQVSAIVIEESEKWTDNLKARVIQRVSDATWVAENNFNKRMKAWIHQYSMSKTAPVGTPITVFTDFMLTPVDLSTLSNRNK